MFRTFPKKLIVISTLFSNKRHKGVQNFQDIFKEHYRLFVSFAVDHIVQNRQRKPV